VGWRIGIKTSQERPRATSDGHHFESPPLHHAIIW
jgi:hypothetical protein